MNHVEKMIPLNHFNIIFVKGGGFGIVPVARRNFRSTQILISKAMDT